MNTDGRWFRWLSGEMLFGWGSSRQLAAVARSRQISRALVVVDPALYGNPAFEAALKDLRDGGIETVIFDQISIEPTDRSIDAAAAACRELSWNGIIAIGGGSTLDTAKGIRLLTANQGTAVAFARPPLGDGRRATAEGAPLIAVPTTAGSGSESSEVCVMGIASPKVKTGISDPVLRPSLAVVDPALTLTTPPGPTITAALDVLCHALESLTSRPYPERGHLDYSTVPAFMGANPLSDTFCREVLRLVAPALRHVVHDAQDRGTRHDLTLASAMTALGSATAGVHVPHALSYSVSAKAQGFEVAGWRGEGWVPHGLAVASTVAATLDWTAATAPDRHVELARLLDPDRSTEHANAAQLLSQRVSELLTAVGAHGGLKAFGYSREAIPELASDTMAQKRLLSGSPRDVSIADLHRILGNSYD